jgi:hypothetical protein
MFSACGNIERGVYVQKSHIVFRPPGISVMDLEKSFAFPYMGDSSTRIMELHFDLPDSVATPIEIKDSGGIEPHSSNYYLGPELRDQGPSAYFGLTFRGVGCFARLATLPSNDNPSSYNGPCSDSFGPCYEYVPPWRVILCACAILYAGFLLFRRRGESGAVFLAMALIFFDRAMLLVGHESYSAENYRGPDYPSPKAKQFLHN